MGPAERVEEVRKPAELGPIGPTQTERLSSLRRKCLCGNLFGFKGKKYSDFFVHSDVKGNKHKNNNKTFIISIKLYMKTKFDCDLCQ